MYEHLFFASITIFFFILSVLNPFVVWLHFFVMLLGMATIAAWYIVSPETVALSFTFLVFIVISMVNAVRALLTPKWKRWER